MTVTDRRYNFTSSAFLKYFPIPALEMLAKPNRFS